MTAMTFVTHSLTHLGHDVVINVELRFRPVDGDCLSPQLDASRKKLASSHRRRAMTLELDESEAAVLGLVRDARIDDSVHHAFRHRPHLVNDFLRSVCSADDTRSISNGP